MDYDGIIPALAGLLTPKDENFNKYKDYYL